MSSIQTNGDKSLIIHHQHTLLGSEFYQNTYSLDPSLSFSLSDSVSLLIGSLLVSSLDELG